MKKNSIKYALLYLLLLTVQFAFAQSAPKKQLKPQDYDLWSTLTQESISPNGKWISYKLVYPTGKDTLFVNHVSKPIKYAFPGGNGTTFSEDNKWVFINAKGGVVLKNLSSGTEQNIQNGTGKAFLSNGKFLLMQVNENQQNDVVIQDLKTNQILKIQNIREYKISNDKKALGIISKDNAVELIKLEDVIFRKTVFNADTAVRKNLVWNESGNAIAFLEEKVATETSVSRNKIYLLSNPFHNEKFDYLDLESQWKTLEKAVLYNPSFTPLMISNDGQRVFFYTTVANQQPSDRNEVEIWNSSSKLENGRDLLEGNPSKRPKLVVWQPATNNVFEIASTEHPSVLLMPDTKKAIVFNPHQYEPQKELMGPADLWLTDVESQDKEVVLSKVSQKVGNWGIAPNSRYINYFKDKNWWVYDAENKTNTLIAENITNLTDDEAYPGGEPTPHGFAGWSTDSQFVIIYDKQDVWLISPNGKTKQRITNGYTDGKRYRVYANQYENSKLFRSYDYVGTNFDLQKGVLLYAFDTNTKASGYYTWNQKEGLSKLVFKNARINQLKKAAQNDSYILIQQNADMSPQIVYLEKNKEKVVVKTNSQQNKFNWTKSAVINYKNREGKKLQGVLQYPAGYDSNKKYPLVVYIYEDQSHLLHHYYNPSFSNPDGFSPTNYTTDGYFVLYPDITYKETNPGLAAVDCVEAAVKEVIRQGLADANRVGLIGHSFGGYEASFIATQSKMFAAVVAGAACTDLVGHSLTLEAAGRSQMWRYQTHQMRMGKSLYEDYEGFINNSPIAHASKTTVPLLNWTGRNDFMVDPQQSIALHMAMRNLRKQHTLLLYPDEGHILLQPAFQKDLTIKIKAWFDHYLKGILFPSNSGLE